MEHAKEALLRFGPGIEALDPAELRAEMEAAVADLAVTYGLGRTTTSGS
jgi:hypothetical protein